MSAEHIDDDASSASGGNDRPPFDLLRAAEEVAAAAAEQVGLRGRRYDYEVLYTARAALLLGTVFGDPQAVGWIARVRGSDAVYGLDRVFLPKAYRALDHQAVPARDCDAVWVGDILQCRDERRQGHPDRFLRVLARDGRGFVAETLGEAEVAALYHQERRR